MSAVTNFLLAVGHLLLYTVVGSIRSFFEFWTSKPKSVAGNVVVITGGAQGIARDLAIRFGQLKAKVVILDVDEERSKQVTQLINDAGGTGYSITTDVTKLDDLHRAAAEIRQNVGEVDIVVCSAGVLIPKLIEEMTENDIKKTIDVNVLGYFWTIKAFYPAMLNRGVGHIVGISSVGGHYGNSFASAYSASKFAVRGLMESLEWEIYDRGLQKRIKTTTVYPFFTKTGLLIDCELSSAFLPLLSIEECSTTIVKGILQERSEVYVPTYGRLFCVDMKSFATLSKYVKYEWRTFFNIKYK